MATVPHGAGRGEGGEWLASLGILSGGGGVTLASQSRELESHLILASKIRGLESHLSSANTVHIDTVKTFILS